MQTLKSILLIHSLVLRSASPFPGHSLRARLFAIRKDLISCATVSPDVTKRIHSVDGVNANEVTIDIKHIGKVIILEATAEAQNELVEMAVALEDEKDPTFAQTLLHDDCYGSVLWPAASAVADYLIEVVAKESQFDTLKGLTVLELGTGTGLCSIASCIAEADKVIATDYERIPLNLLNYAAKHLNDKCDESKIETFLFDICDHNTPLPRNDIVIAADIMYEQSTGIAMAQRVKEALQAGSRVIIGCSPGRPGRPKFEEKMKELLPHLDATFVDVEGRTCSGERHELICGENSASISEIPKPLSVKLMDLKPSK